MSETKPVKREPVEPINRRELGPSKSVEVTISQEAMERRQSDWFKLFYNLPNIQRNLAALCPS